MPETNSWHPAEVGEESIRRIGRIVAGLGGELGKLAAHLLDRHGYVIGSDGGGPHRNVLGHPLFELPIWLDRATSDSGELGRDTLLDVCESSLCGYLSVRAEDDYFDGDWDDANGAMMLSGFFRARHNALLAPLVSDRRFWGRSESLWRAYGEAMLMERSHHEADMPYGPEEFEMVLDRSQPLEIPGNAVLSMKGCWGTTGQFAELVRHLTKATQLFDDFVDAPDDLAAGNFTWMVRRLGGLEGGAALRRGMIAWCDQVGAEAGEELDRGVNIATNLGIVELIDWVEARKWVMEQASQRMYEALFKGLRSGR